MDYSPKPIFYKAIFSALTGLPISILLNQLLVGWMESVISSHEHYLAAIIISFPYVLASIIRIFLIDWVYIRFNVDITPEHLIKKLLKRSRRNIDCD